MRRRDDAVMIKLQDRRAGFEWRAMTSDPDPGQLLDDHGRGILLARLSVDSLQYNEQGNQVTLIKRLRDAGGRCRNAAAG